MAILWVATNGYLDDVESAKVGEFETGFYRFLESAYEELLPTIAKEKALSDELTEQLKKAVTEFRRQEGFGKSSDAATQEKTEAKAEAAPRQPPRRPTGPPTLPSSRPTLR